MSALERWPAKSLKSCRVARGKRQFVAYGAALFLIAGSVLPAGCGRTEWPESWKNSLTQGCLDQGWSTAQCECLITQMQEIWNAEEALEIQKRFDAGDPTVASEVDADMVSARAGCGFGD